ncbi:MAG: PQQ-dependent sugar dehydrogenase [Anaerolineae bacterium]|nr:PQQ-dependent sugar dehydrogenase [Anaerolineae bacterium]
MVTLSGSPVVTDVELTPDGGRLLITTQAGRLYVWNTSTNTLVSTPALDLVSAGLTCNEFERGLQSVAVDPAFATNRYIYVFHTWNGTAGGGGANCSGSTTARNRVMRYTLNDNNTTSDPVVVLTNIPSPCGNHNGGDLQFGVDGLLYIGTGDGGCRTDTPDRAAAATTTPATAAC